MIKIDVSSSHASACVLGDLHEITTETVMAINAIYEGLKEKDPDCADKYKSMLTKMIDTAFITDEELTQRVEEDMRNFFDNLMAKIKGEKSDNLTDVIKELKEIKAKENE